MAPRKAPTAAATDASAPGPSSQRPRRAAAFKKQPNKQVSDSEDGAESSSGSEAEERSTRQRSDSRARGRQPATASKAAAATSNGASSGRNNRATTAAASGRPGAPASRVTRSRAQASAPAAEARDTGKAGSSAGLESEPNSDDDVQEVDPKSVVRKPASAQLQPEAAHAASKAAAVAAPPPPPASRGRAAAAAASAAAGPSGAAAAPRGRQPPPAVAASGNDQSDDSDAEEDDEDVKEEEEEEEQDRPGAARAGSAAGGGRGRGRSNQPLVPPTSVESRKRLFELLERRIGGAAGDGAAAGSSGSGRRTHYSDLPLKNPAKKAKLLVDLKSQFDDWHSRLRSNFSVLLYGFGSKRGLLDEFARTLAGPRNRGDAAVLVFHGYNPRCTAKDVVAGVAGALMARTFRNLGGSGGAAAASTSATGAGAAAPPPGGAAGAPAALRALVDNIRSEPRDRHAFVVIHSIDGPGLRGDLSLLSSLAACPQVHVIASIDHALAPLLWDAADAARFRWQYMNAATFQPYTAETSGAQSVLVGAFQSGVVTAGAGTVLRSLVLGAQEVFKLLAEHLLEDEECEGVAFAHLYRMCRERFLVRDERVLRQHLVEFVDHSLVRLRAASDASGELLTIPMGRTDMRAVLDDLAAARGE